MVKQLIFEGPRGAELFYLMVTLLKIGVSPELHENRTKDDVVTEGDLDDLINAVAAPSFQVARTVGTVPPVVLKDVEEENAMRAKQGRPPIEEPKTLPGLPARFLASLDRTELNIPAAREWAVLKSAIERGAPKSHPREATRVRDLIGFLETAPAIAPPAANPVT